MLKTLKLSKFRKHTDLTLSFTQGLNAVRGSNEAGKSTLLEAWAYAFFGSRALRDSLDDVVTWGHNPRDLKVEVEFGDYVVTRSKSGAEVTSMGQVFVTGQTEVTKFCEKLLGCDATTASNLMLSSQMGLRGILESGPKATATLIEDLGEFDLFDRVLDKAQTQLPLGSSAIQEDRVRNLTAQLEAMEVVEAPDEAAYQTALAGLVADANRLQELIPAVLAPTYDLLSEKYQAELAGRSKQDILLSELAHAKVRVQELQAEKAAIGPVADPEPTDGLEAQIVSAAQWQDRSAAYGKFLALPHEAGVPRAALAEERSAITAAVEAIRVKLSDAQKAIAVAQAQKVTASVCGFCNQDVSQFPEVARKNSELDSRVAELTAQIEADRTDSAQKQKRLKEIIDIEEQDARLYRAMRGREIYLVLDDSVIPVKVQWAGEAPGDGPDLEGLQRKLHETRKSNDAKVAACAKLEWLDKHLAYAVSKVRECEAKVAMTTLMPDSEFSQLVAEMQKAAEVREAAEQKLKTLRQAAADLTDAHQGLLNRYNKAQEDRANLQARIAEANWEIETLQFNNTLVRKIRAARPVVGNKLWSMVLSSVSAIFTQMRGESSVVTKGADGFLINGKAVSSFSGSTLDLLGLAVRCALVKTFIPSCGFVVLDEPSAACDQDRTNAMLGYIAASGFNQVLLVTHNDASEAFADNLIQL